MNRKSVVYSLALLVLWCVSLPANISLAVSPEELQKIESAAPDKAPAAPQKARKLLVFTLCNDYKHSSIPYCTEAMKVLGRKTGAFDVVQSDDMAAFKPENLNQYDAVCLNNTTKLDFSDAALRESLMNFVKGGKGIVGIHAATDNFYDWPEAAEMMGGLFDGHPWGASGTWAVKIDEPDHTLTVPFKWEDFKIHDEIYRIKGFSRWRQRVLVSLDLADQVTASVGDLKPSDKDIPISWVSDFGKGRVFYCSFGHNHEIYWNRAVLGHYLAGIQFAMGDLAADSTPSVEYYLQKIKGYEFGQSRRPLALMDEYLRSAYDSPTDVKRVEKSFLRLLESTETTAAGKQYICRKLSVIGTADSVPTLAAMLTEKAVGPIEPSDIARYALERIPGHAAAEALRQGLDETSGRVKVGIINSLGARRDAESVSALVGLVSDQDSQVAAAAATALGQIADASATAVLAEAKNTVTGELRTVVLDAYLNCADKLVLQGRKDLALRIYNELFSQEMPSPVRVAALRGKIACVRDRKAVMAITEALQTDDSAVQAAAISLTRQVSGRQVTRRLIGLLGRLSASGKVQMLSALADRGDKSALGAVVRATRTDEVEVRIAAFSALARLGDASTVSLLAETAATTSGEEQKAARQSLYLLSDPAVDRTILDQISTAEPDVKVELIRSVGRRGISSGVELLLHNAAQPQAEVRTESVRALREIASEEDLHSLVGLLGRAASEAERNEVENTIAAVAGKIPDKGRQVEHVLAFLPSVTEPGPKASLLKVLGKIGDDSALGTLRSALGEPEAEVRLAAVRVLSEWSSATPAPDLLNAAQSSEDKLQRALALRGYIRLVGLESDRPVERTVEMYKKAMALASNADEKKMVLSGLANVKGLSALEMAVGCLNDVNLQQEAAVAVVRIAERLGDGYLGKTKAALQKAIEVSKSESVREQAKKLLNQGG